MVETLLEPVYRLLSCLPFDVMQARFMQRAVLEIALLAPLCAFCGSLVVQFRMAFFSDSVSHSAFTGVALGLVLGIDPWLAVIIFGLGTGMMAVQLRRKSEMAMDTTLGVLFSSTVALGLAIISTKKGLAKTLPGFLYGDILSISDRDIVLTALLLIATLIFLLRFYNQLVYTSLHEHLAHISGVRTSWLETAFAAMLALVVAFSIRAVGILLVTALLVIPAAAARNFAGNLRHQVWFAVLIAMTSGLAGLATSLAWDTATGAAMILWATLFFVMSLPARSLTHG
ncbi:MAG TPA: metal ABC transporter permease [Candidatus Ozemobacteraceae bacterium]|nr:metal ABC transporter permease [Candidatus Ozemobacteraceae bacterium]